MLHDFLQDSWTYQETVEEGREQGREQGREEGRALLRQNIETTAQARFPGLLALIKERIEQQPELEKLQQISLMVNTAHSARALKKFLLALK
jgi:predicted transposase YdaD